MASIRKRGKSWQAIVRLKGHAPVTATRATKREAEEWAKAEEASILAGRRGQFPLKTLDDALKRYEETVSSQKRGEGFELKRFAAIKRDFPKLTAKVLHKITTGDLAEWRDARLKTVSKGTVQREINLFRNVWSIARDEWGWTGESPWKALRMPGDNPPRAATWRWQDIRKMLRRLGYRTGQPPAMAQEEVAYLFLLGLHTGMRQGELCGMTAQSVDLEKRVVTLATHKTMEAVGARRVPITRRAARVLAVLAKGKTGPLVSVKAASVDALFRKYRGQIGIEGLTFHDSRATAATLLSRRRDLKSKQLLCDPLTLARILGHKNLKMLIDVYYREGEADIAARI
jgi:integrase